MSIQMNGLFRAAGAGVIMVAAATGDSHACSQPAATADVSVYIDQETGETIEVHASTLKESAVVLRISRRCEDIGAKSLCSKSREEE